MNSLATAISTHRTTLWGLAYRITGVAADADEVVQDLYLRLHAAPIDEQRPLLPLLRTVGTRLALDRLRARRRHPEPRWLPSPVQTTATGSPLPLLDLADEQLGAEARVEQREGVSMAFLFALEVLTPQQRAVLVLRDVLGWSGKECAEALAVTDDVVRTTLVRARKRVAEARGQVVTGATRLPATMDLLQRFAAALAMADAEGLRACLESDIELRTDDSPYPSANRPVYGREPVARIYEGLARQGAGEFEWSFAEINGLPAIFGRRTVPRPGSSPQVALLLEPGDGGVRRIFSFQGDGRFVG